MCSGVRLALDDCSDVAINHQICVNSKVKLDQFDAVAEWYYGLGYVNSISPR